MKIPEVILTVPEMLDALSNWLQLRGINLPAKSVDTRGYPVSAYEVELDTEEAPPCSPVLPGSLPEPKP